MIIGSDRPTTYVGRGVAASFARTDAPGPKRLCQFAFRSAAGLKVQPLVDRFMLTHALVIGKSLSQAIGDLSGDHRCASPSSTTCRSGGIL